MIDLNILSSYLKMGFKLVSLDETSTSPTIIWSEIFKNPNFWSREKLRNLPDKFHNVATTFGEIALCDSQGRKQFLFCLDIDSEEVLKRVSELLGEWKSKTFVTKTQKDYGYHVYWFEHSGDKTPIVTEDCRKGFEFEIKCGKSLCTLPPSRHRDNPFFNYESAGHQNKVMLADGLYDSLLNEYLVDCLKKNNKRKRMIGKDDDKNISLDNIIHPESAAIFESKTMAADDKTMKHDDRESNSDEWISLNEKQIEESIQYLLPYYVEGSRNSFALGFAGLSYKESLAKNSAVRIIEGICNRTDDLEKNSRIDTLHRTYINASENGSEKITGKTKLKEVICHVSNLDENSADDVVRRLIDIWFENQKIEDSDNGYASENSNSNSSCNQAFSSTDSLTNELLTAKIQNPSEYAISVINKTVKCDDSLVRAVFYAGCSTWTSDPMNLVITAPTSEGKTYTVLEALQFFPNKDVKYIGSMSPKVIVRQDSILVDADTLRPIQEDINTLKKQIKKESKNERRKEQLEEKLENLLANARALIDLRGKIYVFLEPPNPLLWIIIKPIMSHDKFVMEHPYVESNTFRGIHVRSIITLGFPTFIFCTAKDESKWDQWEEIVSRSLIMSPNMSSIKYRESTILNAQRIGLPTAMQETFIRSKKEIDLARKCAAYLKNSISRAATVERKEGTSEGYEFASKNPVWIPYQPILGATLPAEKGTEMRTNRRLMSLIRIISLAKSNQRYQLVFDNQILTIAAPEDLTEVLYIMQNSSGLSPYKVKFFNEIFYPLYKRRLQEKLQEEEHFERDAIIVSGNNVQISQNHHVVPSYITLTANEICDYYNLKNPHRTINSDNLRKTYLNELVSTGWIEALDVREGNTKKVYYPIISPPEEETKTRTDCTSKETEEFIGYPEFPVHYKINIPMNYIPLPQDWLNIEVLRLWKCRIDAGDQHRCSCSSASYESNSSFKPAIQFLDQITKVDANSPDDHFDYNYRKKITMTDFVRKYNSLPDILSRHFSRRVFDNNCNKAFGGIKHLNLTPCINTFKSGIDSNSSVS